MSDPYEIARLNILLELFSYCSEADDLATFLVAAGGRVRWLLEFERFTVALAGANERTYWTMTRDRDRLEEVAATRCRLRT